MSPTFATIARKSATALCLLALTAMGSPESRADSRGKELPDLPADVFARP